MNNRKKSLWKKLLVLPLSLAVLVGVALLDPDIKNIESALRQVSPLWIAGAFCCALIYYLMDALMYHVAIRLMKYPQKIYESILTTMLGFFYSALTPFQSGGQPMQVLQMRRRGIPVGVATSALMVKFLAWQLSVTILGTLGLVFVGANAFGDRVSTLIMLIIGYTVNAACVVLAFLVLLKASWILSVGNRILAFLHRIKLIKKQERYEQVCNTWSRTINDYKDAVRFALQHKAQMLLVLFISLVEALAYMSTTYFIYRGFGFDTANMLYVILLQSLLFVAVSFIPLPGASIASEGGFYLVFDQLFSAASRFPAMLLWRVCTYYLNIILGLVAVVVDSLRASKRVLPEANAEGNYVSGETLE